KRIRQSFLGVQLRGPHISQAILHLPAGVPRGVHAFVVDFDLFGGQGVVINDHSLGAADQDLPDFGGSQPIDVDVRDQIVGVAQRQIGDVLLAGSPDVTGGDRRNGSGSLI